MDYWRPRYQQSRNYDCNREHIYKGHMVHICGHTLPIRGHVLRIRGPASRIRGHSSHIRRHAPLVCDYSFRTQLCYTPASTNILDAYANVLSFGVNWLKISHRKYYVAIGHIPHTRTRSHPNSEVNVWRGPLVLALETDREHETANCFWVAVVLLKFI